MLKKVSDYFYHLTSGKLVLIFLALQMLFNLVIFPQFMVKSPTGDNLPILDLMFGFTPQRAYEVLNAYGEEGRQTSLFMGSVVDSIYPLVYTGLNILTISYLSQKLLPADSFWRLLNLTPIVAMLADYAENMGIISLIQSFPTLNNSTSHMASTAGMIKWIFAGISIVLIIGGLIGWGMKSFKK
jgi:hypothetical protein